MERLWMGLLVLVPIVPKAEVVNLGGVPILLDDLVLSLALLMAMAMFAFQIGRASCRERVCQYV